MLSDLPFLPVIILSTSLFLHESSAVYPEYTYPKFCYDNNKSCGPKFWKAVNIEKNTLTDFMNQTGTSKHDLNRAQYNNCHKLDRPTPFNLYANQWCTDGHEILTRQIKRSDCKMEDMKFMITPHSLRTTNPIDDSDCRRQSVDYPNGFGERFFLQFIDVHLRSEHVIDGQRFDAEIMMYHLGTGGMDSQMAATSVLLDGSGMIDNEDLQPLIDKWQMEADRVDSNCENQRKMQETGTSQEDIKPETSEEFPKGETYHEDITTTLRRARAYLDDEYDNIKEMDTDDLYIPPTYVRNGTDYVRRKLDDEEEIGEEEIGLPRIKMFPYTMWPSTWYYRYEGQLPYPPCYRKVHWRVFDVPLKVSRRQIKWMARLLANYVDEKTCEKASVVNKRGEAFRPLLKQNYEVETVLCKTSDFDPLKYPVGSE